MTNYAAEHSSPSGVLERVGGGSLALPLVGFYLLVTSLVLLGAGLIRQPSAFVVSIALAGVVGIRGVRTDCARNALYMLAARQIPGTSGIRWYGSLLAHALGLLVGAWMMATLLFALTSVTHFPSTIAGAYALLAAFLAVTRGSRPALGSSYRVPAGWRMRFGDPVFAAIFGIVLGFGVIVALPSIGFAALLGWALIVSDGWKIYVVLVVFASTRALTFATVAATGRPDYPSLVRAVRIAGEMSNPLSILESGLLLLLGLELLR